MKAYYTITAAFYVAVKQWTGACFGGSLLLALLSAWLNPPASWSELSAVLMFGAMSGVLVLVLTFVLMLPYVFVVRGVLQRTAQASVRAQQRTLAITAALWTLGLAVGLMVLLPGMQSIARAAFYYLPWVLAAAATARLIRPHV